MADEKQLIDIEALSHYHAKAQNYFVAKEVGKGLSQENFTTAEKQQLAALVSGGIPSGGGSGGSAEDEIIVLTASLDENENLLLDEASAEILNNYTSEKPMLLNAEGMWFDYLGDGVFCTFNGNGYLLISFDGETRIGSIDNVSLLTSSEMFDETTGKIKFSYMPDLGFYDDVVEGYLKPEDGLFYKVCDDFTGMGGSILYDRLITGESGKIYLDLHTNNTYRWGETQYVRINPDEYTVATNADIDALFT